MSRRRTLNHVILFSLVFLLGFGLWSFMRGDPGRGPELGGVDSPDPVSFRGSEERREDLAAREPADLADLKEAITRTSHALERSSWDEAAENAQAIRERWVSFKPAMRAQAGTRMWNTTDTDAFSSHLDNLQENIAARRGEAARNDTERLFEIANRYDTTREGPPNDPSERGGERLDAER